MKISKPRDIVELRRRERRRCVRISRRYNEPVPKIVEKADEDEEEKNRSSYLSNTRENYATPSDRPSEFYQFLISFPLYERG